MDPNADTSIVASFANIQDAIARLGVIGLSADADAALTKAADDIAAAVTRIEADTSRTIAWRLQQEAREYGRVLASLARSLRNAASKAGSTDADDAARVFGTKGLPGDPASLAMSRRDAADRVADITDPDARQRLLESATRSGDEVLAHALVEAAINAGDLDTVNEFAEDRPALAAAVQRLWNTANSRLTSQTLVTAMALSALTPPRLLSRQAYEIETLASAATAQ